MLDPCRAAEWERYGSPYEALFMVVPEGGGWLLGVAFGRGNGADNDLRSALGLWTTKQISGSAVVAIFCE